MHSRGMIVCALVLVLGHVSHGLVGYDCAGHALNITSLSLIDIGDCDATSVEPDTEETDLQLLQLSDYDETRVIQCRLEIDRTIYYCGMHSHISAVHNGRRVYLQEINREVCHRLHESGSIDLGKDNFLVGLAPNATAARGVTIAGKIQTDGRCMGTQFSDPYGSWENVIVQASVKISLKDFSAPIKRATNEIILPSGVHCKVPSGHCKDIDGEDAYWEPAPVDDCHFKHYNVLYEGRAIKLSPKKDQTTPIIYTITTQETTFALTKTTELDLCGFRISRTEHPKLFIFETRGKSTFRTRTRAPLNDLDIFTYVNSKFVYVEKHLKTQLTQLYKDLMEQKCTLERQVLLNALSLYSIAPDEMAFRIMKAPGFTAIAAGEVIHLIKCIPINCKLRPTDQCYNELPIVHGNRSAFLLPGSRIITDTATPKDCNELVPSMYKIHDIWYRFLPKPVESLTPPIIQPLTRPKWKYVSPAHLATSGIYTPENLERLREHIMFPVEKPAILSNIARGASGQTLPSGTVKFTTLLDENTIETISKSAGIKIWEHLVTFGSASAGILAIFIILRFIKLIIDTIIHGYALHTVYGWSLHLLGALWSSVTHLLIHIAPSPTPSKEDRTDGEPAGTTAPPTTPTDPPIDKPRALNFFDPEDYTCIRAKLHNVENS